jgi:hypothetical protein
MKIAILFWCYKNPAVCADRVKLIRNHNPEAPIYVLYGGAAEGAQAMDDALSAYADDFWQFDLDRNANWKWKHGDRLIARWHEMRGSRLPGWTHLFVAQWDMMIAARIDNLVGDMPENAAMFTGLLDVNEVKDWWMWVRGSKHRLQLLLFRLRLLVVERYAGPVFSAPFIVVCAPRAYFDRHAKTPFALLGFIEYRCPTFAAAWGFGPWSTPQLEAWRPANPATRNIPDNRKIISAAKTPVSWDLIRAELQAPDCFRVFHPVHDVDADGGLGALPYQPA